ncbi:NAD-glutamate dehydrogenase [Parenemella sanctibonifatiensis]|uniref:NAD-glutamate dehydrogenase n=1 Tax=Parenemella sanctibonifatiensis TaxID=2016505 RepID=A0A255EH93_9ACTN|nr:NAD-glutamate dehydrogenase [Parenemella sanctibonifatiensis]OYN90896.1 NAD-glutamate dehydrogenase [Parenemella sanctibonifatiensis]
MTDLGGWNSPERSIDAAELVSRLVATVTDLPPGFSADEVSAFVAHYFLHADTVGIAKRPPDVVAGAVRNHFGLAQHRAAGVPAMTIEQPAGAWAQPGLVVVQIVTDDMPFLVDSLTLEANRQGWMIRELFHPQYVVDREDGDFVTIRHRRDALPTSVPESWIHLELLPAPGTSDIQSRIDSLKQGLLHALDDVRIAVTDWQPMRNKTLQVAELLGEGTEEAALMQWLAEDHFTFLAYEHHRVEGDIWHDVNEAALGLSRDPQRRSGFDAKPTRSPVDRLVITKEPIRSTVHRAGWRDYIGVRELDEQGNLVAEHAFLGLLSDAAYRLPVGEIPVARAKAEAILTSSGLDPKTHGASRLVAALEQHPRDDLLEAPVAELGAVVTAISQLRERRQIRLFANVSRYGRFASLLVFMPRERYSTEVRIKICDIIAKKLGPDSIHYEPRLGDSVLARLHLTVVRPADGSNEPLDIPALERQMTDAVQGWDDRFHDAIEKLPAELRAVELPEGYKESFTPAQAVLDLAALQQLSGDEMATALYRPDIPGSAAWRLKVLSFGEPMTLTEVMPHLSNLGVTVVDERPYVFPVGGRQALVYDFGLALTQRPYAAESADAGPTGTDPDSDAADDAGISWPLSDRERFMRAFEASYRGQSDSDQLNTLVLIAGLRWTQVTHLRAISRYLQQANTPYSQAYIAEALCAHPDLARGVAELFSTKFDPDYDLAAEQRPARVAELRDEVLAGLDAVDSLDHDTIVRQFVTVIDAVVRTNAYTEDSRTIGAVALKLVPSQIGFLPEPRPAHEIFVASPRFEGVHLRFGAIARGGLRWSDRAEDFRTEVLGLVKAQMVKNTVIVPVGAKGGFYAKQLPDPAVDRAAWQAEGVACYRGFITSLLSLTDNIVDQQVITPDRVIRYDGDDPYLVVAADKGTATFSDEANAISEQRGFWLADAFASGGSVGYDHKGMGITARGAWESVKRHFREMGRDCQSEDFTCIGIGDMAGDVFGNGMLLSRHIRLVAAFNHRHIFLDPNPDAEASWQERKRLFDLPRSNWSDYNTDLISAGGGVHERSAKSIPITAEVRQVLGLPEDATEMAPNQLIHHVLQAPVDLLWNGGIGTYVKATDESHADVRDKTNDALRVNGNQLRAKAVGEGGNLGVTQRGRIEYARNGGRINADFIDNSAGVDTSDHEVNIKILLAAEVEAGRLERAERDELLASMTDAVAGLVLAHNIDQNLALANAVSHSVQVAGAHEEWMRELEAQGYLNRRLEEMPSSKEMARRIEAGEGLASPELAILLAYTKIMLEREVLASDLPEDPYVAARLPQYFPQVLQQRYAEQIPQHRLAREIITTVAVNRFVNSAGISAYNRLHGETNASPAEIIRAQLATRAIFRVGRHEVTSRSGGELSADAQTRIRMDLRLAVERGTRWMLLHWHGPVDISAVIAEYEQDTHRVIEQLPELIGGGAAEQVAKSQAELEELGVEPGFAALVAGFDHSYQALSIVHNAHRLGQDTIEVAKVHFRLGEALGLDLLRERVRELPRNDRWELLARAALRDELANLRDALVRRACEAKGEQDISADAAVEAWCASVPGATRLRDQLVSLCEQDAAEGVADLARLSVAVGMVRSLLAARS